MNGAAERGASACDWPKVALCSKFKYRVAKSELNLFAATLAFCN